MLKEYILADNSWYNEPSFKSKIIGSFLKYHGHELTKYLYYLRKQEYYINTASNKIEVLIGLYYERKKNKLGLKLGLEIPPNCFGEGLQIYHGNIVVNPKVKAGVNCKLHGGNCIGNNGKTDEAPVIGDNVDIGFGSILIGDITIPNNAIIGANALVNKSFDSNSNIIAGVPAKIIK